MMKSALYTTGSAFADDGTAQARLRPHFDLSWEMLLVPVACGCSTLCGRPCSVVLLLLDAQRQLTVSFLLSLAHCKTCLAIDDELNILPITQHIKEIKEYTQAYKELGSDNQQFLAKMADLEREIMEKDIYLKSAEERGET